MDFVYLMHLNPNVRNSIKEVFVSIHDNSWTNVFFLEPLDYLPFVYLMSLSYLGLTESGGIKEEAPGLGKPVLLMQDTTEHPEAVEAGTLLLVGTDKHRIIDKVSALFCDSKNYEVFSKASNPNGDGRAPIKIIKSLIIYSTIN